MMRTIFYCFLVITFSLNLWGGPIINLDFSGLAKLSDLGKALNSLSGMPPSSSDSNKTSITTFHTKQEMLAFHNKYITHYKDLQNLLEIMKTKPLISIKEGNLYEVIYTQNGEKITFSYVMNAQGSLHSLFIILTQFDVPVWIQENTLYSDSLTPGISREIFYSGLIITSYYQHSKDIDGINIRKIIDYDEMYHVQNTTLLCHEEAQSFINTQLPLATYIQHKIMVIEKDYRDTTFDRSLSIERFTLQEAYEHCDALSIDAISVWYLPTRKELLELSSNQPSTLENNTSVYIKKEYLDIVPKVKNSDDLTFWTSNLSIIDGYELGEIISFAYSFDELENAPLDLSSDKKSKHFVWCKKADDVINIVWEDKFLSLYGNNFRLSLGLKFLASFDIDDDPNHMIDCNNDEAYFPLKNFLVLSDATTLYILDLQRKNLIVKSAIPKDKKVSLKNLIQKIKG